jgi:deazaflavin-dependent oxidoreductase (nitroreductase family)
MTYNRFKRWLYADDRPNIIARLLNRGWAILHTLGIAPDYFVTLEVVGRRSGKTIAFPLVMATIGKERFLVSMLGENAAWVKNIRAADGQARLRHGRTEAVRLVEIPVDQRAAILPIYLRRAPGARPHIPVDMHAPLEQFERIADQFPVFRVERTN